MDKFRKISVLDEKTGEQKEAFEFDVVMVEKKVLTREEVQGRIKSIEQMRADVASLDEEYNTLQGYLAE
jgi:hypothetical protein